jgi:hypothetical protein
MKIKFTFFVRFSTFFNWMVVLSCCIAFAANKHVLALEALEVKPNSRKILVAIGTVEPIFQPIQIA